MESLDALSGPDIRLSFSMELVTLASSTGLVAPRKLKARLRLPAQQRSKLPTRHAMKDRRHLAAVGRDFVRTKAKE